MREKLLQLCTVALLLLGCGDPDGTAGVPAQSRAQEREVAFVNVNVVPMDSERVLADQTVLVRGERIVEVGPAGKVKVPAGALRVDGRGKYLMPGLAEMHGHVPPPQAPKEFTEAVLLDLVHRLVLVDNHQHAPTLTLFVSWPPLRPLNHYSLCPLVHQLQAQLSRLSRDDG